MCTIIYIPKEVQADKKLLQLRHKSNSDSWGLAYYDGKLHTKTGTGNFEDCYRNIRSGQEYLIHFRTGTSGTCKSEGVQPILHMGVAIFHNGNFPEYFGRDKTDTQLWAEDNEEVLKDLEGYKDGIIRYCKENGSRMAFMDSNGKVYLINEEAGVWEKGMWFSNNRVGNYAGFGYSGINYYKKGEKRYFNDTDISAKISPN